MFARLNDATRLAVRTAIYTFNEAIDAENISDEARIEAYRLLIEGVTKKIDKFEVSMRPYRAAV